MSSFEDSLVSIIMPAFNAEKTIIESVKSVLLQTYRHYELIIIDDYSNDKTIELIDKLNCENIKIIRLPCNKGVANARNEGISMSKGEYITFLDSDDIWEPNKLEIQMNILKKNVTYCCHGSYKRKNFKTGNESIIYPPEIVYNDQMYFGNLIPNLTGIYNAKILGKVYQKNIGHEDYLMWIEVLRRCKYSIGTQSILATYRINPKGISSDKLKSFLWTWHILNEELKLPLWKAFFSMFIYAIRAFSRSYSINFSFLKR